MTWLLWDHCVLGQNTLFSQSAVIFEYRFSDGSRFLTLITSWKVLLMWENWPQTIWKSVPQWSPCQSSLENYAIIAGLFCPRGKVQVMRLNVCEASNRENRPGHNTGSSVSYSCDAEYYYKGKSPPCHQGVLLSVSWFSPFMTQEIHEDIDQSDDNAWRVTNPVTVLRLMLQVLA